jgi:hypothetical protein
LPQDPAVVFAAQQDIEHKIDEIVHAQPPQEEQLQVQNDQQPQTEASAASVR